MRRKKPPYNLVNDKTVVQIGAPRDTLMAGRSRGVYFGLLAGPGGKNIIIEPDPESVKSLRAYIADQRLHNTIVFQSGAWSEKRKIKLYIDDNHPATNFSEGIVDYNEERMRKYRMVEIEADTVDAILDQCGVEKVDLVSITTNWAEMEILAGGRETGGPFRGSV